MYLLKLKIYINKNNVIYISIPLENVDTFFCIAHQMAPMASNFKLW